MARTMQGPKVPMGKQTLPVSKGGTGSNNLVDAAAKLKVATVAMINQVNGLLGLDATGKIPLSKFKTSNRVSLNGPTTVGINQSVQFAITDFDSFKTYSITVSAGSATLNDDNIVFIAPSTPQSVTLSVNGKPYTITIT